MRTLLLPSFVVVTLLALVGAAGCGPPVPSPPVCAQYLACFFPGTTGTTYPASDPAFSSYQDANVQSATRSSYGDNGACWTSGADVNTACTDACTQALADDCTRPSGPICVDATRTADFKCPTPAAP